MKQPNNLTSENIRDLFLVLIFSFVLSGCQLFPLSATQQQTLSQKKHLYSLGINQALSKGEWLISEYEFHLAMNDSPQRSFFTPFYSRHYKFEQKILSGRIVEYAKQALEEGDIETASRCYTTLRRLEKSDNSSRFVEKLAATLSAQKETFLVSQQRQLSKKLDRSIQEGQLIESSQLIAQLKQLKQLSKDVIVKIEKAKGVLSLNAELLNEKADHFYRDGNIQLANSLWHYLLKFDPDNQSIQNKLSRSARVIKNMNELRDKGHQIPST